MESEAVRELLPKLSRGLVIGPQAVASAPKAFPSGLVTVNKMSASPAQPTSNTSAQKASVPLVAESFKKPNHNSPAPSSPARRAKAQGSPRHHQRRQNENELSAHGDPLRIIVIGYPQYTQPQDLTQVFNKFGTVKIEKMNNKMATLLFTAQEDAKQAVEASKKVNLYGEFMTVYPYNESRAAELANKNPKRDFSKSKENSMTIEPQQLDLSGSFSEQLERLLAAVRLTQEDVSALAMLYSDVEAALQPQWPGCVAVPFGSIPTGLGSRGSDADCFVHVPGTRRTNPTHVTRARRLLVQYPDTFADVLAIPRANTPIVKFHHLPTATNCDLTFKTPLGSQNTKLIGFLLHADPRLIPAAVAIKYWAKIHELSGTGRLTNYALTLLIIFYLQQPPRTILPSVNWLQRDVENEVLVDHWNTGFDSCRESLPEITDKSTISELIGGFFEYYSTFDFDEMAVCPFLGTPIKKDTFADLANVPSEFERYKTNVVSNAIFPIRWNTPICVQDPFEQSHNVASAITGRFAAEISAFFKFAANAYEKTKENKCEKFLETILLQKPKILRVRAHPQYRVNLLPRFVLNPVNPEWMSVVREVIFRIFEKILRINLDVVEEEEVNPNPNEQREKYTACLTKAVWRRKQYARYPAIGDFVERQTSITDNIYKYDKEVLNVNFHVILKLSAEPVGAAVVVRLADGDLNDFREFGKFFLAVMQGWFLTLVNPLSNLVEYAPNPRPRVNDRQHNKRPVHNGTVAEEGRCEPDEECD